MSMLMIRVRTLHLVCDNVVNFENSKVKYRNGGDWVRLFVGVCVCMCLGVWGRGGGLYIFTWQRG